MHGLCGDYNGIESDDMRSSHGERISNTVKFFKSWQYGSCRSSDVDNIIDQCHESHTFKTGVHGEDLCEKLTKGL